MDSEANPVALLRRFARKRESQEYCELCSIPIPGEHRHLLESAQNRIVCACDACAVRFEGLADGRFELIPRDARFLADFEMPDADWHAMALPINLVFIFKNSRAEEIKALYPSPAGAVQSLLPAESWAAMIRRNPVLAALQPNVEALLINRVRDARDYFIAPIDVCHSLTGLIRMHWRGLSGGEAVWGQISEFFSRLKEQSETIASRPLEVEHA